jgi:NADPH:quinone reductase-like Zn-dependent oxidoreductase
MHRLISRLVPIVAASLIMGGCGNSSDNSVVAPPPPTLTDTFSGTLTLNGATAYSFTVTGAGNITAQLTTLSPDSTSPVGLLLGTWNGSVCQIVLFNDNSVQGSVVVGTASAIGSFCVRIYDAAGTVVNPQAYVIDVFHL